MGERAPGLRIRRRGLEQFALRPHRHVLASSHGQGAGQEAGHSREEDGAGRHARGRDTQDEGQVGDEAVVRAEHRGSEAAGQPGAGLLREGADDLGVDRLVRGHAGRGPAVGGVGGLGLGLLRQRQDEDGAEDAAQEREDERAERRAPAGLRVVAQEHDPVLLVTRFRIRQSREDLRLLAFPPVREGAVEPFLESFVRQVLLPPADQGAVGAGQGVGHRVDGPGDGVALGGGLGVGVRGAGVPGIGIRGVADWLAAGLLVSHGRRAPGMWRNARATSAASGASCVVSSLGIRATEFNTCATD